MIIVRNLRLGLEESEDILAQRALKKLKVGADKLESIKLAKRSLDARKKNDLHYTCAVTVKLKGDEGRIVERARSADVAIYAPKEYEIPKVESHSRPVVVGFGPAGMFAALVLSMAGARPIVIERGAAVEKRSALVEHFRATGELDTECNVQFGEGGAGTFSDGKLNTGTKDWRMGWMLSQLHAHGAAESVLYDAKPHIGTDVLINVVRNIREHVIALGGEIYFETKLESLIIEDGRLCGIAVSDKAGQRRIDCERLILAIGHSARDSFERLYAQGIPMTAKAFSMGVRIEHKQSDIDLAQYGRQRETLPAADYSLNVHLPDGKSAYTFCMCPGGEVIAAASENGGVVTNGMSYSRRDGDNANSALLVTLGTEDFPYEGPLGGMYWQREIEKAAYDYGGGNYLAPAQLLGDFLENRESRAPGSVTPTYRPGVVWGDIRRVLPQRIWGVLQEAIPELSKKLRGFDAADAVLTAPESRSSSPVRITRDEYCRSAVSGLYPCGEGAGYAGGISSAAVDGMRCAEAVLRDILA